MEELQKKKKEIEKEEKELFDKAKNVITGSLIFSSPFLKESEQLARHFSQNLESFELFGCIPSSPYMVGPQPLATFTFKNKAKLHVVYKYWKSWCIVEKPDGKKFDLTPHYNHGLEELGLTINDYDNCTMGFTLQTYVISYVQLYSIRMNKEFPGKLAHPETLRDMFGCLVNKENLL